MGDDHGPDLQAIAAEVAAELQDVDVSGDGGVVEYQRHSSVFARVTSDGIELRLPEDIAEAAVRSPDTSPVTGRPGWIRLVPVNAERHVIDRAMAWFQTAWRHAGERPGDQRT